MRAYFFPFLLGNLIGLAIAFWVAALPDSWLFNAYDYGNWQIPLWDSHYTEDVSSKFSGLTNQALFLRYAAFILSEGYWYIALPTIFTCGYTRLRIESQKSPFWNRIGKTFDWTILLSTGIFILLCIQPSCPISDSSGNPVVSLLSRMTFFLLLVIPFWATLICPLILGSLVFMALCFNNSQPKIPEYRFAQPNT